MPTAGTPVGFFFFAAAAAAISSKVSFLKYKRQLVDKTQLRKGQYLSLTLGYARMEFHFIKQTEREWEKHQINKFSGRLILSIARCDKTATLHRLAVIIMSFS